MSLSSEIHVLILKPFISISLIVWEFLLTPFLLSSLKLFYPFSSSVCVFTDFFEEFIHFCVLNFPWLSVVGEPFLLFISS